MELRFPLRGGGDAGEDLKQSGFLGTVAAHDADDIAFFELEADIFERSKVKRRGHADPVAQACARPNSRSGPPASGD